MGAIIAILVAGGAIAFAAFRAKAFEPEPDTCHKIKNAVENYGGMAGPKGEAAAEAAKQYGDTICNVAEGLKDAAKEAVETLAPVANAVAWVFNFGGSNGPDDPDEWATETTSGIRDGKDSKYTNPAGGVGLYAGVGMNRARWLELKITPDPKTDKISYDAVYNWFLSRWAAAKGRACHASATRQSKEFAELGYVTMKIGSSTLKLHPDDITKINDIAAMDVDAFASQVVIAYENKYKRTTPLKVATRQPIVVGTVGSSPPATPVNPGTVTGTTRSF